MINDGYNITLSHLRRSRKIVSGDEKDELELEDVAKAIDEAGFNVGALRVRQALKEIIRLKKIEAMALACDGIDMGRHYEVPTDAWEALMTATWEGQEVTK